MTLLAIQAAMQGLDEVWFDALYDDPDEARAEWNRYQHRQRQEQAIRDA